VQFEDGLENLAISVNLPIPRAKDRSLLALSEAEGLALSEAEGLALPAPPVPSKAEGSLSRGANPKGSLSTRHGSVPSKARGAPANG